jgi:hypothetical protein
MVRHLAFPIFHKRADSSSRSVILGYGTRLLILHAVLLAWFTCATASAQDQNTHDYTVQLVRTPEARSLKPVLADVTDWLPLATVQLEREADVLHIATPGPISLQELRSHVQLSGFELGNVLLDGVSVRTLYEGGSSLPWLDAASRDSLTPAEIMERKTNWVHSHPEEYQRLLDTPSSKTGSR